MLRVLLVTMETVMPNVHYAFRLLRVHLADVEATIARATVGSGGLEYPSVFIRWLHQADLNRTKR